MQFAFAAVPDHEEALLAELEAAIERDRPEVGKRTLTSSLAPRLFRSVDPQAAAAAVTARARDLVACAPRRAAPPPAAARDRSFVPRAAAVLARAGIDLPAGDVDALGQIYRDGVDVLGVLLGRGGAGAETLAASAVAHARHHLAPLDGATRAAVEATTGRTLPAVDVAIDPSLADRDRLGEASGRTIRLAPSIAADDDPLGRRVRVHEAAHVAQAAAADRPLGDPAAVERDAHAVAGAAARGEHRDVGVRADPDAAHGFGLSDVTGAIGDAALDAARAQFPEWAAIVDHGWDGVLQVASDFVSQQVTPLLPSIGLDQLGPMFSSLVGSFRADLLSFGALTGCCECLETALAGMLTAFDGFLAGDHATALRGLFERIQEAETGGLLDLLALSFDRVRAVWSPILVPLADAAITLGDRIWKEWVCYYAGLDPTLPPLQAIEAKIASLWKSATEAFATVRATLAALWETLRQHPVVAALAKLGGDVGKVVGAIRKVQQARSRDPKVWLGILAQELQGTIFEELIAGLERGREGATSLADSVDQLFRGLLQQLGILRAWNTSVPYIQALAKAVQGWFAAIEGGVASVQTAFQQGLARVTGAIGEVYAGVKPLLDFVVGLSLGIASMPGGLVLFVTGQVFRALPPCHQAAIVDFILDLFIHAVEWLPAVWPPTVLIRSAALGYFTKLRAAPVDQKVHAMETVMRLVSGDVELMAGVVVGFVKGLWNSSLGLIVRMCFPLIELIPEMIEAAGQLVALVATPFEQLYATAKWMAELAAQVQPIDGPREGERPPEEPAAAPEPAPEEPAGDEPGVFEPLPPFPGFPFDPAAIFDEVLRGDGITREDLDRFLASVNVELAALGEQIGGQVADQVLALLNDDAVPYRVGEAVGMIAGWACGELVVVLATLGVGSAIGASIEGGQLLIAVAKNFPKLVGLLNKLRAWLKPVIDFVAKIAAKFSQALRAMMKWVDDLILWAEKQVARIIAWLEKKLGRKAARAPGGDDEADEGAIAKDAAKDAWTYLRKHLDLDQVHDRADVDRTLARSGEDGEDGVAVKLGIAVDGERWSVSADAAGTTAKTYGDGWAPTAYDTGATYFAFRDDSALHEDLLDEAGRTLVRRTYEGDTIADKYAALRGFLDGELRRQVEGEVTLGGIELRFEVEGERSVEADGQASITLVLTPNSTEEDVTVSLDGPGGGEEDEAAKERFLAEAERTFQAIGTANAAIAAEVQWIDAQLTECGANPELADYRAAVDGRKQDLAPFLAQLQEQATRFDEIEAVYAEEGPWTEGADALTVVREAVIELTALPGLAARPTGTWDAAYVELARGTLRLIERYRADHGLIRSDFYPKDYDPATQSWKSSRLGELRQVGELICWYYGGQKSPRGDNWWSTESATERPTIDHADMPVAEHWNTSGRGATYAARKDYYNGFGDYDAHLCIVPQRLNSSDGAGNVQQEHSYDETVELAFRGAKR